MDITVRDLIEQLKNEYADKDYRIRIYDIDEYEHINFMLKSDVDTSKFNNVFDQDMLDSYVIDYTIFECEESTIDIIADIEL